VEQSFVVVVNGHRQVLFGSLLADYVLVEVFLDLTGFRRCPDVRSASIHRPATLLDDVVA